MIRIDPYQLLAARKGNRAALETIAREIERPVFNLAMRMLANRSDAEDATQEILIRIITHLGTVREPGAAGAWAFRIACRHLAHEQKRGRVESLRLTFGGFADDLLSGQAELAEAGLEAYEVEIAAREVRVGCTLAMLTCLSRTLRMAYLLGDVLELTDSEAADALTITPATYRQRLRRARRQVVEFLSGNCGLVRPDAACHCDRRVVPALACGRVERGASTLGIAVSAGRNSDHVSQAIRQLEAGRSVAALLRSNPDFASDLTGVVSGLLDNVETDLKPGPAQP